MAGTSESQLIKHFESKEGLLEALFEIAWKDLNGRAGQLAPSDPDSVPRLRAIVGLMLSRWLATMRFGGSCCSKVVGFAAEGQR